MNLLLKFMDQKLLLKLILKNQNLIFLILDKYSWIDLLLNIFFLIAFTFKIKKKMKKQKIYKEKKTPKIGDKIGLLI